MWQVIVIDYICAVIAPCLPFSAIFAYVWFYFSQSAFSKALLSRKEVDIGLARVMWLE